MYHSVGLVLYCRKFLDVKFSPGIYVFKIIFCWRILRLGKYTCAQSSSLQQTDNDLVILHLGEILRLKLGYGPVVWAVFCHSN